MSEQAVECPHSPAIRIIGRSDQITEIPLAGTLTPVSGYHDCQRLMLDGGTRYGPEVALYASDGTHPRGAVAQLFARDGDYTPLGIRQGFNCLYLVNRGGWEAWMVPSGGDDQACTSEAGGDPGNWTRLEVRVASPVEARDDDVPPVVRWDWDAMRNEHYIGLKCGSDWCEAGRPGFIPSPAAATELADVMKDLMEAEPTSQGEFERVSRVKGWYDQQRLAVPDGSGGLVPGEVTGTILPHPLMGQRTDRSEFEADWVPASYVHLDGESPIYKAKLNLDQGINRMDLRYGDAADILPADAAPGACEKGLAWWMRIVSAQGDIAYRCVAYEPHHGLDVPGTARWRWDPDDEKTWITCPKGCCTVN